MKYVKQVAVIWGFTMAGELLHSVLPLPVPAGVYGLFLLLGALVAGVVRLESVEGTGNFLMDTMTLMFIPAMVGLMEYAAQIREVLVPFAIVIAISTVAVMVVTGRVAETVIGFQDRRRAAAGRSGSEYTAETVQSETVQPETAQPETTSNTAHSIPGKSENPTASKEETPNA